MSIYMGNNVRARGRTFQMGRMGHVVKCDETDCEWYSTAAASEDHAKEIELNHYRVTHPTAHAGKLWEIHGMKS